MSFYYDKCLIKDLVELKKRFNYDTIIETGTHTGHSAKILSEIFDNVYTCELLEKYYSMWNDIEKIEKIKIYKENSITFLPKVFSKIKTNDFYLYLDAHGVIDNTNHQKSPLLKELDIVAEHGLKPIIMIHDFDSKREGWQYDKVYDESLDNYIKLDWDYIKNSINKIYGEDEYILSINKNSDIARALLTIIPKRLITI